MLSTSKKNMLEGKEMAEKQNPLPKMFSKINIKSKLDGCTGFAVVKLGQDRGKNMNVSWSSCFK